MNLFKSSVFILGLGVSGISAAHFLLAEGYQVIAYDDKMSREKLERGHLGLYQQGLIFINDLTDFLACKFDFMVVSPGIPPSHPFYQAAIKLNTPIISEAELALRQLSKEHLCLGVTGTNGKTTVTLLIEYVLNSLGVPAKALGNSGIPLTSTLTKEGALSPNAVVVAELSSFQLETMHQKCLDAAVLLNITPDHLERYPTFEEYASAKLKIFHLLKPKGVGYIEEKCFNLYKNSLNEKGLFTYGLSSLSHWYCDRSHVYFNGVIESSMPSFCKEMAGHDLENCLAALALSKILGINAEAFFEALKTFKKPSHRLEFVKEINGVHFIDDSKATNVDAVVRAVESIPSPIVLIAGGVDKGASYKAWLPAFSKKVKAICTIGQAAEKIEKELDALIPIHKFVQLEDAVIFASKLANQGEVVLLSPGCSSFDMFSSYMHRGEVFKEIVKALAIKGIL